MESPSACVTTQAMPPATPPVATEPSARPKIARRIVEAMNTTKNRIGRMPPRPCGPSQCCSGSGSGSPSTTEIIRSTPAAMPPAKSPSRKRGVMVSSMMRFETRSVSAPSSPRPTSMRSARSCIATRSSAPSSGFSRPSFQASTTRIEYCSIASGCVVGTISTAICAPLRASKSASFDSRLARSAAVSVPVRSVTRAASGGIGWSDCARGRPVHSEHTPRPPRPRGAAFGQACWDHPMRKVDPVQVAGSATGAGAGCAGAVLKSTVGGCAIAASFSTVKFGFTS